MTTQTHSLADYTAYGIGKLSTGQDGGVQAESYYLIRARAPRSPLAGPTEASPWPTLAAGCLLGLFWLCAVVGAAQIVRWLLGG